MYKRQVDTGVFEVLPVDYNVILNAPDVKMIYHDGTRFVATLTDKQGNPIGGAAIEITINGRSYDKITDEKGSVSLGLNLDSGIYSVVVKFKGSFAELRDRITSYSSQEAVVFNVIPFRIWK